MICPMDLVIIVYDMVLYEWAYIPRCCKLSSIITCIKDLKMMVKHWKIQRFGETKMWFINNQCI
jgi:hypothetical protein